jgi:hypothetical protein
LLLDPSCREDGSMATEIQTIIATIIGGIVVVVLVMQESPGMLAVARLFVPVGCGPIFFPHCWP